jgi:nitrite reductase/ring-hydroxylating ferredoxin subunit
MTKKLIKIAEVAQLPPGSRKLCAVEERRVALFNLNGTIHAIDNHCTHRDGPVAAGELKDAVITCPCHGWRFNVTSGRCLEAGGTPLRLYPVIIEGNDILIDVTTSSSEADDAIYSCLVRYGVLGHVSRVGSNRLIPCSRGDRVVVRTDRGLEIGELLREMTEDDRRQLHELSGVDTPAFQNCQELLAERSIPVTAVDAELLFDDQTIIIYYLGQHTDELGPLSIELSKVAENRLVQFQPIENIESSSTDVAQSREQQEIKRSKQERVKESSQFLRGTILDELSTETDKFPADDVSLLKFHGTYQQDDRDARKTRNPDGGKVGESVT